jgi:UDP:flavonoid glycosyltransferase YjiC (YdhE family)
MDSPQSGTPILYGFSPTVIPKPPDWTKDQCITGYWFLDAAEEFEPKAEVLEFLSNGSPPLSIGFGSMVEHEKEAIRQIVIDALRETNQRAVLLGGWSELDASAVPDFILCVKSLPHGWLFPRVAAAIHHGGAGTTAAALRAGVPNVIAPWFGDQFFWAERVQEIGAGPEPIPRKKLDAAKLSKAIRQALNNVQIQANAVQIGQNILGENGIETAVSMIESFARDGCF